MTDVPRGDVPDRPVEELRQESFGQLLSEIATDTSTLVKQELALAKAEMTDKAKAAGAGVGLLAGAGVAALVMLGALTALLVIVLDLVLDLWLAALIVTLLWLVVTLVLAVVGRARLTQATPVAPEETIQTLKEDVTWAKNTTSSSRT